MRYPYDRLLTFLLSRRRSVNEALEQYNLPPVGDLWLVQAEDRVRTNAPPTLLKYLDGGDDPLDADEVEEWAKERGILDLWLIQPELGGDATAELDLAYRIFSTPAMRSSMTLLLLSRATREELIETFDEQYSVELNELTLQIYERIFWDWESLGSSDWTFLAKNLPLKSERHDMGVGMRAPSIEEVRDHLELETEVSPLVIVSQIATRSFLQWKRAMDQPDPLQASVDHWQNAALKAASDWDRIKRANAEEDDVLKAGGFQTLFAVTATRSSHPTVADLQGEVSQPQKKISE